MKKQIGKPLMQKWKNKIGVRLSALDKKKLVLTNLPYALAAFYADRAFFLYRNSPGEDMGNKLLYAMEHADRIFAGFVLSNNWKDLLAGITVAVVLKVLVWQKQSDAKKLRKGIEYGSARWGNAEDIKPYMSENPWMNIPLTATEAEYYPLVQALHGQVIRISPVSDQYINPMDLNLNYSEEDNPLSLKADFILSLCELIVGGKNGLEPVEKTIIDRCVRLVYQEYLADPVPEKMPILEDLYNLLRKQEEPEAQRLATSLEIYVTGSLNVFNHRTNVDINNRIVCFDIKELGKQLKKIGMLIVQDQVWNRVTINRSAHKSTRYYVDEFHLLLKEEQTAAYSVEIWKRFRKWGGIPTGITQNIKDLLASREIENIFENSDFIYMLNQASGDRQILAKQLNISPTQLSYVTNSNEGEGLLFYGNVIIPFVDRFPKNSLYKIMTTRPEETAEAG